MTHLPTRPQFCCFYLHSELRVGWVRGRAGNRLEIMLEDGSVLRKHPGDLIHTWEGDPLPEGSTDKAVENAAENPRDCALGQIRERLAGGTGAGPAAPSPEAPSPETPPLESIHREMETGGKIPFAELAERRLGKGNHGWAHGLLFVALLQDRKRFRYAKGAFRARSQAEMKEWEDRETERREREAWEARVLDWAAALDQGEWPPLANPSPSSRPPHLTESGEGRENREGVAGAAVKEHEGGEFLAQLQSLLALEKRSPYWKTLGKILDFHTLPSLDMAARIKGWLKTAHAWPDWPAIWLQRSEVPLEFPASVEDAAGKLARLPVRKLKARDFRDIPTYSIDAAGTRDFDDAYSILGQQDGWLEIAIHIAEPSPKLEPGHPLFEEAALRMATVYTLAGVYPMLPRALSEGRFSLLAGKERETVTFLFRLREGEAEWLGVERGVVRLESNLDFAGAERLLEERPGDWGRLALLCQSLTDARARQGALIAHRREAGLDISDPQRIRLWEISRTGPVHQIVEELAIAYNREAGRYCFQHGLPALYRVQLQPSVEEPGPGEGGDSAPAGTFRPANFSTRPERHAGLACDRYIQVTSPIRRFPDLVMQRQIVTHALEGRGAFMEIPQLEEWAARADQRALVHGETARRIEHDWIMRYLMQQLAGNRAGPELVRNGVAKRLPGTGAAGRERQGKVWLDSPRLPVLCMLPAGVENGDRVTVRIESVNRDRREVWATLLK